MDVAVLANGGAGLRMWQPYNGEDAVAVPPIYGFAEPVIDPRKFTDGELKSVDVSHVRGRHGNHVGYEEQPGPRPGAVGRGTDPAGVHGPLFDISPVAGELVAAQTPADHGDHHVQADDHRDNPAVWAARQVSDTDFEESRHDGEEQAADNPHSDERSAGDWPRSAAMTSYPARHADKGIDGGRARFDGERQRPNRRRRIRPDLAERRRPVARCVPRPTPHQSGATRPADLRHSSRQAGPCSRRPPRGHSRPSPWAREVRPVLTVGDTAPALLASCLDPAVPTVTETDAFGPPTVNAPCCCPPPVAKPCL
jgi:hypothetical protein